ncbi:single-stranded DNA-binding protein [bacterium]|nr:single-stranded DNA-binding protein [bacterium]
MSENQSVDTYEKSQNTGDEKLFSDTNISTKTGRLVRDAEIVGQGKYTKLTIACNKNYKDQQGEIKTTTNYINALVSINLKEAFEVAKTLKKGDWAYLKGEDRSETFETAEGYRKQASTLFAYKVLLKSPKAEPTNSPE